MSTEDTKQTEEYGQKVGTVKEWGKLALHYPLCPSGARVGIRIPDLPRMIEAGEIPQHLLEAAIGAARKQQAAAEDETVPTPEEIIAEAGKEREFSDTLLKLTVVEPDLSKATEADLTSVPFEDKQFIVAVATRAREFDAEGEHIAGLTSSTKFRRFRLIGEFDPTLEDL